MRGGVTAVARSGALASLLAAAGCLGGGETNLSLVKGGMICFWFLLGGLVVGGVAWVITGMARAGRRRRRLFETTTLVEGDGQPGAPVQVTFTPRARVKYALWLHMDSADCDDFLLTFSAYADGHALFERTWLAWQSDNLCGRQLTGDTDPWNQQWASPGRNEAEHVAEAGWDDWQGSTYLLISFLPPTASPVAVTMRCLPKPGAVMPRARFRVTAGVPA